MRACGAVSVIVLADMVPVPETERLVEPLTARLVVAEREPLLTRLSTLMVAELADREPLFVIELVLTARAPEAVWELPELTVTEEPAKLVEPAV